MKDRKPIDFTTQYGFRKNHTQIATEVRELEADYNNLPSGMETRIIDISKRETRALNKITQLEKKLKEAVEENNRLKKELREWVDAEKRVCR